MTCHNCQIECKRFGKDRKGNQRFRCRQCAKTFSERPEPMLGTVRVADEKALLILQLLVEGSSIRSIERITGVHRDTIMRVLLQAGAQCQRLLDSRLRGLQVKRLEFDEIFTYVLKKPKRIKRQEDASQIGDQFVYVALDPETKLVVSHRIGKRNRDNTWGFVYDVRKRTVGRPQITSDGFKSYFAAIDYAFGADVDYAYLVKAYGAADPEAGTYNPPRITAVFHQEMFGRPDPLLISTSYVERQNLTMRTFIKRFSRLTLSFSKRLKNLKAAVALHFAWYNFGRVHGSLRVTPAMQAGLTDHIWSLKELIAA